MKKALAVLAIVAMTTSALQWSPSVAAAAGTNLVPNPSFETGTAAPASWSKVNGSGRNRGIFTYPVAGYDAAKAARATVTSYAGGDYGWGSDAFAVTAGSQYDVSDYSKASVSSTLLAVYTKANGSLTTSTVGTIAGTNAWQPLTKVVTVPAGVTTMSLRHVLRRTGTLDVDAFSVVLHVVVPVTGNLVLNGDVEIANATTPALPASWTTGGFGTNTASFTYPVTGQTGKGVKVDVTGYTNGDAKWVFAPIVTSGGKTYSIKFDYTSTVATNVTVEYHMTDGTYTYAFLGNPVASASWTTFSNQITAPAGSDSFTAFQALVSNGSLTTDNYIVMDITNGALNFPQGMITLDFDDTLATQYTVARPILNAAGIKASFYAVTDPNVGIESDGYMTWAQVLQLKADGHEIGDHTQTHPDLGTLTAAQQQAEIVGAKNDLIAHGITPTTFVYPFGVYNAGIQQIVQNAGFTSARSVGDGFNYPGSAKMALLDKHIESTTTIADVQGWINQAIANKTWLILELHEQATNPAQPDTGVYYNTPTMMQNIVNAIKASGIKTVTQAEGTALMNP